MRRGITLTFTLLCLLCASAVAQEQAPVRSISVSGTVESRTAPDQIMWQINLIDTDKDMLVAKTQNDEKIKAIVALQGKLGVGKIDFETGQLSIRREYERGAQGRRGAFKHYVVKRRVTIRQRDLNRFDEYLDAFVASAEMEVDFDYISSRIHEVRAETRLLALKAAQEKAAAMAAVVGAKLGAVITINEGASEHRHQRALLANAAVVESTPDSDLATETFVPGAITVSITVHATFELLEQ